MLEVVHNSDAIPRLLRSLRGELALRDVLRENFVHEPQARLDLRVRLVVQEDGDLRMYRGHERDAQA